MTLTLRIFSRHQDVDAHAWDQLLALGGDATPFLRHAYLAALHDSGSATADTGWGAVFLTVWEGETMAAACAVYLKNHSYGEYVFDWAWANAYADHGLAYYPKAVVAVPFTPVPGARLLARSPQARGVLVRALVAWCGEQALSSLHLLFLADTDVDTCRDAGLMLRNTVQFHWHNRVPMAAVAATPADTPQPHRAYADFDDFLASLTQEKRKKIRQERRKVAEAGVSFRWSRGADITTGDWDFFYRCYARTYREHGNAPYLTRDFFRRMEQQMPENWLLFVAEKDGQAIASSLIALGQHPSPAKGTNGPESASRTDTGGVAYGRYWGALERVDCLHFEACYYQPIAWCIAHGFIRFEGGAQGEHKMARALMPVATTSAHWLARPDFSDAVERFLEREGEGIAHYMEHLDARSPFRHGAVD